MDYGAGDHKTAGWDCVQLFGCEASPCVRA